MRVLTVVVLAAAVGCSRAAPETVTTVVPANAVVRDVVDGDTIDVRIDGRTERVRLLYIDTPETKDERRPVMCFGKEATERTSELVPPGTLVRLERDVEARDRFGRLLATVVRASDGLDVNLELAATGYAQAMTIAPNVAGAERIRAAVASARGAGLGLWGACGEFGAPAR